MTEISSWSQTDASNNSAPPAGAPEGQNPSTVNDVMRAMMGGSARRYARATPIVTAGTATAYTVTYTEAPAALVNGETFLVEFHVACGTAPTVNINGLGAVPIHKYIGGAWAVLAANDVQASALARLAYHAVSGAMRAVSSAASAVVTAGSVNTSTGHRLTLTTALPVTTADVTAAATVFWTPYRNNLSPINTGTAWATVAVTELSFILDALNHPADKNFDVLLDYNAGAPRLVTGPAWTSDTARAAALGTDAAYGFVVNNASMSVRLTNNGGSATLAAKTGLYLGTIRTSAGGQTEDSAAKRFTWNNYNRVSRTMMVVDLTDNWAYSTTAFRQARGFAGNQLDFVRGLNEDSMRASYTQPFAGAVAGDISHAAIGLDGTTVATGAPIVGYQVSGPGSLSFNIAHYHGAPGLGRHVLVPLEMAVGTITYIGDSGSGFPRFMIHGEVIA